MKPDNIGFSPELRPSEAEFSDFYSYMQAVEKKHGEDIGLVKIVPPKKWKARTSDYTESLKDFRVIGPIEQNAYGKGGLYELLMIPKKAQNFEDFWRKSSVNDVDQSKFSVGEVEMKVAFLLIQFWKNLAFSSPIYGADILGSLMDQNIPWNLTNLPSLLSQGLNQKISGVNSSYLYFGAWKTMFAWHKEDLDLYSINYLHTGKPKFWYSIPRSDSHKLEKFIKHNFPENMAKCPEYLRHKTIIVNPYILKQQMPEIKITKMIQNPGEFIVTLGSCYHTGFNFGVNIAEAVNFAIPKWLSLFTTAKPCCCVRDSVKIDKFKLLDNLLKSPEKNLPEVKEFQLAIGKSVSSSSKSQLSTSKKIIKETILEKWMKCSSCKKWRKVTKHYDRLKPIKSFSCKLVRGLSCKHPEQNWRKEKFHKWI